MNPKPYIHVFAVISLTALTLQLVSDFWLPLVIGAGAALAVVALFRR